MIASIDLGLFSVPQEILVNVTPREVRVALLENAVLQEVHIERSIQHSVVGNIYKGRIKRLLPGIQAAFIELGFNRPAFLHLSDLASNSAVKNATDIQDVLHVGQDLILQVYKNALGSKGPRLTTEITLPSRYLVLTPGVFDIALSQKITDAAERERLLKMLTPGPHGGFIFRTAAEGISAAEIEADSDFLNQVWTEALERAQQKKSNVLIYQDIPIALRMLRDTVGYQVERIRVDERVTYQAMQNYAEKYVPALTKRIELYTLPRPIFDIAGTEDALQQALERKINLASGAYLIFDQTEAMTTIDVNSGSNVGRRSLEETIWKINAEAVKTIAHQIRLRNLGGIIIIDFIDMQEQSQKNRLLEALKQALQKDSAKIQITEVSSLGLVQLTRKRVSESIEHILCVSCPLCQKRGSIKSRETVCYDIFREVKRIAQNFPWPGFLILAAQTVVDYLLQYEADMLTALEAELNKPIQLKVESLYTQEQYNILPYTKNSANVSPDEKQ